MISFYMASRYCTNYTKIENYELAVKDESQIWNLHHRLETHFSDGTERPKNAQLSMKELKALNMYWKRPPEELIFLTKTEHNSLHYTLDVWSKGRVPWNKGKKMSDESKRKMSESHKGKKLSEETKRKLSEVAKGHKHGPMSEETKRKLSELAKKRHQNKRLNQF